MTNLAKWLSVHLQTKWLRVRILLQSFKLQISRLFWASNKMAMWHDKNTQSPCHPCYIFEYVYLNTFYVNFLLKSHVSSGHIIPCLPHYMEGTDNEPFSGLIGPRHMTASRATVHQNWVVRCSPYPKHLNTILCIWLSLSIRHQNNNNNDSLLLLFDGLCKVKADYMVSGDSHNVTFFETVTERSAL